MSSMTALLDAGQRVRAAGEFTPDLDVVAGLELRVDLRRPVRRQIAGEAGDGDRRRRQRRDGAGRRTVLGTRLRRVPGAAAELEGRAAVRAAADLRAGGEARGRVERG